MSNGSEFPLELSINAWTGDAQDTTSRVGAGWIGWAQLKRLDVQQFLAAPEPVDQRDWRNSKVGWGLILPDDENLSAAQKATADDAPEPIQRLWKDRAGSPVFRYRRDNPRFLRRYFKDRAPRDVAIAGSPPGTGDDQVPFYLLIYGGPDQIPWRFQFELNTTAYVGRLALKDQALENYIKALLDGWQGAETSPRRPVVWSTDHSKQDISNLMRHAIGEQIANKLAADDDVNGEIRTLFGAQATLANLINHLKERRPGLIVTTSHGSTGPLDNVASMAAQLGCLVDQNHAVLKPSELLAAWQPDGAIWYAHACCGAGNVAESAFAGLFDDGISLRKTLTQIAAVGECIAPIPQALLGADKPLRAFIGHVEPTFDWTLRQPETRQVLTSSIVKSVYDNLYRAQPEPVGMAFRETYRPIGTLFNQWHDARDEIARGRAEFLLVALRAQLAALDRRSMVILGDPTATIAKL